MRLGRELVGLIVEIRRISFGGVCDRLGEQPVCEPGIPGKQRAVQVRPDRAVDAAAFEAGLAVVPEPVEHTAQWLRAFVEKRPSGVVLEAGDGPAPAGDELALEQDVADHPRRARHGLVGEEADAGHERPVAPDVPPPEQLVAAAHRKQRGAVGDRLADRGAFCGEIGSDGRLLAVLAAADVEEVDCPRG